MVEQALPGQNLDFSSERAEELLAEPPLDIPANTDEAWHKNIAKPSWLKVNMRTSSAYGSVNSTLKQKRLHTVCQGARCPNISECWSQGTAAFMIMGDICTRGCAYCAVTKGRPAPLDEEEPEHFAQAVQRLDMKYVVLTSVTRDDLPDGGAAHFAAVIKAIKRVNPQVDIEVLIPDLSGDLQALDVILEAGPRVVKHNVETVARLYGRLRPKGSYQRCMSILRHAHECSAPGTLTKSGLMVGLGESNAEIMQVMDDLREQGVELLTLGQYLRPSLKHVPVMRYRTPEEFLFYRHQGLAKGFRFVESAPLARSSYHARSHVEALLK